MVKGKVKEALTIKTILNKLSEYQIYRYYVGHDFTLGKAFNSPFRKESNPSFSVIVTKEGYLHHMDFTDTERKGTCIDFVKQLFNLDFPSALAKIDLDFGLGIQNGPKKDYKRIIAAFETPNMEQKHAHITAKTKRFDTAELHYWAQYGITEKELKENDVYSIDRLYLNKRMFPLPPSELVFGYLFGDKWKIYRPLAPKKSKWLTNVPGDRMSGLHRITDGCHNAVVTKAKKDEIVLAKILPNVCSVQSESTVSISPENVELLNKKCRKVFLNFDSDEVGVQSCKYYNQFGFKWVNCPKGYTDPQGKPIKDFSDLARYHGLDTVVEHFKKKGII